MSTIWDDRDIKSGPNVYVQFDAEGDSVEGVITALVRHVFVDDETGEQKVCPKLTIKCTDGEERILTAGQVLLKKELAELRPDIGDWLKITLVRIERRGPKRKLKHWKVEYKKGDGDRPPF